MSAEPSPKSRGSPKKFNSTNGHSTGPRNDGSFSPTKSWSSGFYSLDSPKFHNLSASVLQHSASSWKFPQAQRFPEIQSVGPRSYTSSKSSLGKKSTSMGFGGRTDVTYYSNNQDTLQYPSPQRYQAKSEFEQESPKAKTFGLSYTAYDKVFIPGNRYIPIPFTKHYPGPGTYHSDRDIPGEMTKFTFKGKGKLFNEGLASESPKCSQYTPKNTLTSPSRFLKPTFGFGEKSDFTKAPNQYPGPGTYTPPTFVDKIHKKSASYRGPQFRKPEGQ